jgi:hypothetical protein
VLKKGGTLAAATNGKEHLRELHDWIARAADCPWEQLETMIWGQTLGFNLENGAEQLKPFFQEVRLLRYPDSLEVSEVEPLLDYSDSMVIPGASPRYGAVRERLRELWSAEIRVRQAVHISKESGIFLACK